MRPKPNAKRMLDILTKRRSELLSMRGNHSVELNAIGTEMQKCARTKDVEIRVVEARFLTASTSIREKQLEAKRNKRAAAAQLQTALQKAHRANASTAQDNNPVFTDSEPAPAAPAVPAAGGMRMLPLPPQSIAKLCITSSILYAM